MTKQGIYINLIWLLLLTVALGGCLSPHEQPARQLDLKAFARHQSEGAWQYTDTKGNDVLIQKDTDEYWESITTKTDYFTHRNNYFLNGRLNFTGQYFHENGFNKGIWTYYDQKGKVTRTEDEDAPFKKYPWEKVLAYLNKNRVDIQDKQTNVSNVVSPKGNFWLLSWKTGKTNEQGLDIIKHVRIAVSSGQTTIEKETYCCID
jgi:hypothetical protein